jgi:GTP-binding protein Era
MMMSENSKSGFVSIVGRPNAGKSSLLNWLLGEKITLVSHKANATRRRSNAIVMHNDSQIIFIDTPGIHQKEKLLNQFMLEEALKAIGDCDIILFLAPISDNLKDYEEFLELNKKDVPHILLLTKIDEVTQNDILKKLNEYSKYSDKFEAIIPVSIKRGTKKELILDEISKLLPKSPYLYDTDILTTELEKDIFKEFIRESLFENLSDEIPYESDVIVEKVKEEPSKISVFAKIIVEKNSQKGMIIGKNGATIKRVGRDARIKIEDFTQTKIFLKLIVVVKKGWSKSKDTLKEIGYDFSL